MKGDIDKIILNAYWLYRDDLISKDTLIQTLETMKIEEKKRKIQLFEEETAKVTKPMTRLSNIESLKRKNG